MFMKHVSQSPKLLDFHLIITDEVSSIELLVSGIGFKVESPSSQTTVTK